MKSLPLRNCCFVFDLFIGVKIIAFSELVYLAFSITLFVSQFPVYEEICMIACRAILLIFSGVSVNALKKRQTKWLQIYICSKIILEILASAQFIALVLCLSEQETIRSLINKLVLRVGLLFLIQMYMVICLYSMRVKIHNQEIWPQIQKQLEQDPSVTYQQICLIRRQLERGKFGIPRKIFEKFTQKMLAVEIRELPTITVTQKDLEENKECAICLGDFTNQETLTKLICKHYFHPKCIEEWLQEHTICPLCRTNQRKEIK